jgi:hypothetical protein
MNAKVSIKRVRLGADIPELFMQPPSSDRAVASVQE